MSMDTIKEKEVVYQLMREIMAERRVLTKQYFDLKNILDGLDKKEVYRDKKKESIIKVSRQKQSKYQDLGNGKKKIISFDRISKNIISILKQSPVPLSNKQITERLNKEYESSVSLKNLTCNILPKMINERSLPIQKAYRGYWQYKQLL